MKNSCIIYFSFLILTLICKAQNHETLYWTRYAPEMEFKYWKINGSVEDRIAIDGGERRNLLANIVLLYKLGDVELGFGFAHFTTYDSGKNGFAIPELRPFQQFGLTHKAKKLRFNHRIRTEQRFQRDTLGTRRLDSYGYTLRARYRVEITYSVVKMQGEQGHFGAQIKNEVFLSAGNIDENFDQNRLYGGLIYQITKPLSFEVGYMWVNKNQIGMPDQNSDVVRITLRHCIDLK